jgi:anti-sigma factor RsiW
MTDPNDPADDRLFVHAYVDGELDPANARALERQMAADPALLAEHAQAQALRRALRERLPGKPLPPHLRSRIEKAVGMTRVRPSWQALAASVALALMVASGSTWLAVRPAPGERTAEAVVDGHVRALMATQPIDVASSDRHTVKPWFNGRIAQAPRVVDLAREGFSLVGGRIDVVAGAPVATLVYRKRQHLISLAAVPADGRAGARRTINGYNLVGWNESGMTYWAVSDLGAGEVDAFVNAFRTAPPEQ